MSEWLVVLLKIVAMVLVILVGWLARRRGVLAADTTGALSRFVVDITIPAMVFTSMLRTVDPVTVRDSLALPLVGAGVVLLGFLIGWPIAMVSSPSRLRPTVIFLVGMTNWIYLPLPIAIALFGDDGMRAVLLCNVGATIILWSVGVSLLRGQPMDRIAWRHLALNPGLLATLAGIALALTIPMARTLETAAPATLPPLAALCGAGIQALALIGSLTIPLSLVVTGAQLGSLNLARQQASIALPSAIAARLVVTPLVTIFLVWALARIGLSLHPVPRMVTYLIAGMPMAISCSIFTERFGGDTSLAARGIFYSTLLSILTVPLLLYLVQRLGL